MSLGWLPSSSPAAILTASRAGATVHQTRHSQSDRSRHPSAPCTYSCCSARPMQLLPTCTSTLPGLEFCSVAVYATRQGASAFQTGLLSASPAIISVLFALLTGWWLENRSLGRSVFWAAALHRIVYLLWVPLPVSLPAKAQVWALMGGGLTNYLPKIPEDHRPACLAWCNVAPHITLLLGRLAGPFIARGIGVPIALALLAMLRLGAALMILVGEK